MRFFGPGCWREVSDALDRYIGESRQDGSQIVAHGNAEPAAALDHRQDGGHARSGLRAADVDPVFPSHRDVAFIVPLLLKY